MAAIFNLTKSTNAYYLLLRARAEARIPSGGTGTNFLAQDSTDKAVIELAYLNEVEREMMLEFPPISLTSAAATTVASTRYVALPATVLANRIVRVEWNDSSSMQNVKLKALGRLEVEALPACYRQTDDTTTYPMFYHVRWSLQSTSMVMDLYPLPSDAKAMTVWYLQKGTAFVAADLTNSASTSYSLVPDEMIELPALKLAIRFAESNFGGASNDVSALKARYAERKSFWADTLAATPDIEKSSVFGTMGYPRTVDSENVWDFSTEGDDW